MKKPVILLWLLCHALCAFSQGNEFLLRDISFPKNFNDRIITYVEQDKAGLLWFVTNSGLYRYDGNEIIHFGEESKPAVLNSAITTIFADRQNNLWIGAKDGLTRFNLSNWTTTVIKAKHPAPALSRYITAIGQGQDGTIYAGSRDGKLYRVVNDSLEVILNINQAYPGQYNLPFITFIAAPYPGQIWLGTAIGKLIRIKVNNGNFSPPEYFGLEKFQGEDIQEVSFGPSGKCLLAVPRHGLYLLNTRTGVFEKIPGKYGCLGKSGQVFMEP